LTTINLLYILQQLFCKNKTISAVFVSRRVKKRFVVTVTSYACIVAVNYFNYN